MYTKPHSFIYGVFLTLALVVGITTIFSSPNQVQAAPGDGSNGNVSGYLWSSTIGWISLNCNQGSATGGSVCSTATPSGGPSPYSVNVIMDTGTGIGYFDGYAWSPNIGWISFRPADVASCGPRASLSLATNQVSGWARALAGNTAATATTGGGWNGCMSLRGTSSAPASAPYGVSFNPTATTNSLAGTGSSPSFSWGGINVGWVSWANAHLNLTAPVVDLKVNGDDSLALGPSGGPIALTWTTQNVSSADCSATVDWSGAKSSSGGSQSLSLGANTSASIITKTYTITCTDLTGSPVADTVTVTIATSGGTSPFISLLVNNSGAITIAPPPAGGTPVTLKWEALNIEADSCKAQSSSPGTYATWNGALGGATGTVKTVSPNGIRDEVVIIPASATGTITFRLKNCRSLTGTVLSDRTVTVSIAAAAGPGGGTGPVNPKVEEF